MWYSYPPFRVHHNATSTFELEWENDIFDRDSKVLTLSIIYQQNGKYLIKVCSIYMEVYIQ